jgi:hypothetical protein
VLLLVAGVGEGIAWWSGFEMLRERKLSRSSRVFEYSSSLTRETVEIRSVMMR